MKLETFFEKFDQFADAPDAVARMRELVLNFAVQGKLVPQDPEDQPTIKWSDSLAHEYLQNWILGKVVDLVTLKSGNTLPKSMELESGGKYLYLKVGDMNQPGNEQTITCSSRTVNPDKRTLKSLIPANSIIFPKRGGAIATNKKRLVLEPLFVDSNTMAMICPEYIELRYLQIWFLTIELWKLNSGTSVPQINNKDINPLELPLPPLAEQKRIVAKVDELMALCDRLEAQQQERDTLSAALARASLARFADAATPANLNFLFHKSYDIPPADLRKSILTLAVQGKLVPQDPDDEPALEWSDSLAHETLPNWILGKVVDLVTLRSGNTLPKSMELESGGEYLYLKVGDMNQPGNEQTITCSSRTVNPDTRTLKSLIPANSIIFPKRGGAIATNKKRLVLEPLFVDSNTMAMICPEYLELRYLQIWFLTIDLWKLNSGTSVPQINNKDINPLELPVPPVAEQCRIVAKVDQMLALVDELETHLAASRTTANNLLEALVAELTAASVPARRGDA